MSGKQQSIDEFEDTVKAALERPFDDDEGLTSNDDDEEEEEEEEEEDD